MYRELSVPALSALLLACATLWPAAARAQVVRGEVVGAEDQRPVAGAFVALIAADGRREAGFVTDDAGRFLLRARTTGTYTLRVERIGLETITSEALALGSDTVRHRFVVPARAVLLDAVVAQADGRACNRREDAPQVLALWEEIRKALDVTVWTQAEGIRYTLLRQHRELDPFGVMVHYERRVGHGAANALPYATVTAAELVQRGFVRTSGHESVLLGIDAHTLLSSEFLDTYCFRLVRGDAAGEVGLAFEPASRRSVTDIRGVLWVDRASAELRRLDFSYLNLAGDLAGKDAGGTVRFTRLPGGGWIISNWLIRSPVLSRRPNARTTFTTGLREEGGSVLSAQVGSRVVFRLEGSGVVEGSYREAMPGMDAAGALVHLSGTPFVAVTDASGRFRLDGVPPGRYALAYTPAWFEDMRVPVRLDSITVVAGGTVRRDLVGLTENDLLLRVCPDVQRNSSIRRGILHGSARDGSGAILPNVEILVQWRQGRETYRRNVFTNGEGRYIVCGLPRESEVSLRIMSGSRRGEQARVVLTGPLLRHDFF